MGVALGEVAFIHWRYSPDLVRNLLPAGTAPDTFAGACYVGLVAFRMRCYGEFLEFNVRTYSVDARGKRATVFLGMEADRLPWVLAAQLAGLPYRWSRMSLTERDHIREYRSARRWPGPRMIGTRIRLGLGERVEGGPFEHFLTARWRLHHRVAGTTVSTRLIHDPWPLHQARLLDLDDNLVAATGLPAPSRPPASVLYSPGVHGRFGLPRRLDRMGPALDRASWTSDRPSR